MRNIGLLTILATSTILTACAGGGGADQAVQAPDGDRYGVFAGKDPGAGKESPGGRCHAAGAGKECFRGTDGTGGKDCTGSTGKGYTGGFKGSGPELVKDRLKERAAASGRAGKLCSEIQCPDRR